MSNELTILNNQDVENMDDSMLSSMLNEASGVKTNLKFKNIIFKAINKELLVETDDLDENDKKIYKPIENLIAQILKIRSKIQNKKEDDVFYSNEFDGDRTTIYGENKEVIFTGSIWDILGKNAHYPHLKERFSSVKVVYLYATFTLDGEKKEGYYKMYLTYTQEKELNRHINSLGEKALALYPVSIGFGNRMKANKGEETRVATAEEIKKFEDEIKAGRVPGAKLFYSMKISYVKTTDGGLLQSDKNKTVQRLKNIFEYIEAINSMINSSNDFDTAAAKTVTAEEAIEVVAPEKIKENVDNFMNKIVADKVEENKAAEPDKDPDEVVLESAPF